MGFNIRITEGLSIIMKVNIKSYMMDIAVAHYYLGLGGAYCYLCDFTKKNNVQIPLRQKQDLKLQETLIIQIIYTMHLLKKMEQFLKKEITIM